MALEVTPVYRNLGTRVTFLGLEAEDLFAILALAVVTNILGRFLHREIFGLPMNMFMQYLVPLGSVPAPIRTTARTTTETAPRDWSKRSCGRCRSAPCGCRCGSRSPRGPVT